MSEEIQAMAIRLSYHASGHPYGSQGGEHPAGRRLHEASCFWAGVAFPDDAGGMVAFDRQPLADTGGFLDCGGGSWMDYVDYMPVLRRCAPEALDAPDLRNEWEAPSTRHFPWRDALGVWWWADGREEYPS